jgi:hypothetical protein
MWTATHRERYKDDGRRYPSDLTDTEWETIKRIKGLCGAQPPHKPCWTNAVVLGVGRVVWNRGNRRG